jgi:hypothetical protein
MHQKLWQAYPELFEGYTKYGYTSARFPGGYTAQPGDTRNFRRGTRYFSKALPNLRVALPYFLKHIQNININT